MAVVTSVTDLVGNTPMVEVDWPGVEKCRIFLKMESMNPGGSVKDRIAVSLISEAEKAGRLQAGMTIVEATAGNTGLALAMVALSRGYKMLLIVPDKMSQEKIDLLRSIGAEVRLTRGSAGKKDPDYYTNVAERLATEDRKKYFYTNQFENEANPMAHYRTTGPEIWRDLDGEVDAFVAAAGTGGTLGGAGRYLKEKNPDIRIVLADPIGSVLAAAAKGETWPEAAPFVVEGIGQDYVPKTFDIKVVTDSVSVTDEEAFEAARGLFQRHGLCVGSSAGTIFAGLVKFAKASGFEGSIVGIMCDTGRNYFSKLYNYEFLEKKWPNHKW